MGREAIATCHWRGDVAEVKVLLEAKEIILRGDIRLKVDRGSIEAIVQEDEDLVLTVAGEALILGLGSKEADKWREYLLKPLPTLAEKLGVSATRKAFVMGTHDDPDLAKALEGVTASDPGNAAVLIAILRDETDLKAAIENALKVPDRHIWCVYGKGKFATIADGTIRTAMRSHGFADNKSSGISEQLTATRYRMKV
ncbi:MAG: hypothetical protein ACRCY3_03320 [Sphingorhabdus sp.]